MQRSTYEDNVRRVQQQQQEQEQKEQPPVGDNNMINNSNSNSNRSMSNSSPVLVPRRYPFGATIVEKKLSLPGVVTLVRTLADCLPPPTATTNTTMKGQSKSIDRGMNSISPIPDPPSIPSPRQSLSPKVLQPRSSSSSLRHSSNSGQYNVDGHGYGHVHPSLPQFQDHLQNNSNHHHHNAHSHSSPRRDPPELPPLLHGHHNSNHVKLSTFEAQLSCENVHYTLWISMSWHLLGWAEPSASVFWEMATMFHTLYLASRRVGSGPVAMNAHPQHRPSHSSLSYNMLQSCGSNLSEKSFGSDRGSVHSYNPSVTSSLGHSSNADAIFRGSDRMATSNASVSSAAAPPLKTSGQRHASISAKELPLWFLALQLCMYCAYSNTSSNDSNINGNKSTQLDQANISSSSNSYALQQMMQMRINTAGGVLYGDYTSFVMEHLRLILVLIANPHDPSVLDALGEYLSGTTAPAQTPGQVRVVQSQPSLQILNNFGRRVRMSPHEIERLTFILQRPFGGDMDDSPLSIAEMLVPPSAEQEQRHSQWSDKDKVPILHVEAEVRRNLKDAPSSSVALLTQEMSGLNLQQQHHHYSRHTSFPLRRIPSTESAKSDSALIKTNTERKELTYTNCNRTTIILRSDYYDGGDPTSSETDQSSSGPSSTSSMRLHDLSISCCSDVHIYLLQPFEHATISGCSHCTIMIGAVAGLLHIVNCDKIDVTCASRRILVRDSHEVRNFCFTPSPPLMVGEIRSCQFGPYNTYYEGLREDLLSTGLAALPLQPFFLDSDPIRTNNLQVLCSSNKWKVPVDTSTLETPTSPLTSNTGNTLRSENVGEDAACMHTPILVPASEFNPIFVPMEDSDSNTEEKVESEDGSAINDNRSERSGSSDENANSSKMGSRYGRALTDMLQLSPFKLPSEYERRVIAGIERVKNIQFAITNKDLLTSTQRLRVEEDLNRGFREWLVTSGNLRQVLDLAHLEESKDHSIKR